MHIENFNKPQIWNLLSSPPPKNIGQPMQNGSQLTVGVSAHVRYPFDNFIHDFGGHSIITPQNTGCHKVILVVCHYVGIKSHLHENPSNAYCIQVSKPRTGTPSCNAL